MELSEEQIERLRKSGIRLDTNGVFWHEGEPVTHLGLIAALFRWLDRNPDGLYVLRLDDRRFVYLDVEDAPFVVRSIRWQDEVAIGVLSDKSEQPIDLGTLRLVKGRPYITVRKGLAARLANDVWTSLGDRLDEADGKSWITIAGQRRALEETSSI